MKDYPLILDETTMESLLNTKDLLKAVHEGFMSGASSPPRVHYEIEGKDYEGFVLLATAWNTETLAIKIATVFPKQVPSIAAQYLVFDAQNGSLRAVMDGTTLTAWRTAAVSALASSFLSRTNSKSLLVLGTGVVARCMVHAHSWVRSFDEIFVWGRDSSRLRTFVEDAQSNGFPCHAVADYRSVISDMDIVSSATAAEDPLIMGADISPGTHVDLIGSFRSTTRESDDGLIQLASKYADTAPGSVQGSGDFAIPISKGVITEDDILGDLLGLADGNKIARKLDDEVTVFKSVGTAIADLSAGTFALGRHISR